MESTEDIEVDSVPAVMVTICDEQDLDGHSRLRMGLTEGLAVATVMACKRECGA